MRPWAWPFAWVGDGRTARSFAWLWLAAGLFIAVGLLSSAPAAAGPPREATDDETEREGAEARVVEARVWLTIHRSGEARPDGLPVDRGGAYVEGVVEYELARPARVGERLVLLDFAEAIPRDPVELDEIQIATVLDGPYDRGALWLTGLWGVESSERVGPRRDLVLALRPGTQVVTLRYAVDVPHRYWPFGCVRRRCSLSGAIAPLPSEPARGGRSLPDGRVVTPVRWRIEEAVLAGAPEGEGTAGASVAGREAGASASAADREPAAADGAPGRRREEILVVGDDERPRQYPSVFWGPRWHRTRAIHRGVTIEVLHERPRPMSRVPHETVVQLRRDVPGQVRRIGVEVVELLGALGQPLPPDATIRVVQGPLRTSVAEAHPDVVVLSDQALQILPAERFLKFHQTAIARAVLDMLMERRFRGLHDASVDLWLPGMLALSVTQLWQSAREQADEFAADILRNFTFVPAVDRFLYTQQASFSQAYFRGVEDRMLLRNHPLWFSHELPTGRRLHEKLLDTAGDAAVEAFYRALAADPHEDPVAAAEVAYGHTMGWFFDQWLGPYPSVSYAIVRVHSERVDADGGWRHEIEIERAGAQAVIEPVQLLVIERGGKTHHLVWNGELGEPNASLQTEPVKGRHVFELRTDRKLRTVWLDPRARLEQVPQPPQGNVDPRFDDRRPPSFRFLYSGVGLSIAASEFVSASTPAARFNAIAGFAAFEGSLRRDLRRSGHLRVSRDRETNVGLFASASFAFGDKVNNQRRRSRVRVSSGGAWLNESSLDERGGVRVINAVSLIDDTRRFGWWPERGHWLSATVSDRHTMRVEGLPGDVHDLDVSATWVQMWRLAHDHVLATAVTGEVVIPLVGQSEFRNLARAGGIGGLSGYLADEIFGLGLVLAQAEYRHVYVNDLHLNLLHLGYLRSLGGTLFTGAASVSSCESLRGWFGKDSWYGHVGYSVDARLSIFGVTPQLFRVDLSVPLVRRDTMCLGQELPKELFPDELKLTNEQALRSLPPVNVNVTFEQSF